MGQLKAVRRFFTSGRGRGEASGTHLLTQRKLISGTHSKSIFWLNIMKSKMLLVAFLKLQVAFVGIFQLFCGRER